MPPRTSGAFFPALRCGKSTYITVKPQMPPNSCVILGKSLTSLPLRGLLFNLRFTKKKKGPGRI